MPPHSCLNFSYILCTTFSGSNKTYLFLNSLYRFQHIKTQKGNMTFLQMGVYRVYVWIVYNNYFTNYSEAFLNRILSIHERGKDRKVFTTSGTYPWSFVTQIFHNGQPSRGGDRKICSV